MPRTASRVLNLVLIPADESSAGTVEPPIELDEAWAAFIAEEVILPSGRPGPQAARLCGFQLMRIDRPPTPSVYGNRQGGFHVTCPRCGMALAGPFSSAARRWKAGGPRRLTCPGCSAEQDFTELHFAPPVGFSRFALELRDVSSDTLSPDPGIEALLRRALGGPYRTIASRGR